MTQHIIITPTNTRKRATAEALSRVRQKQPDTVNLTGSTAEQSAEALRQAVGANKVSSLIVAGGDGLIHLAIQSLALTGIPLSILPVGTGNDFAQALGIRSTLIKSSRINPQEPNKQNCSNQTYDTDALTPVDLLRVTTPDGKTVWVASIAIAGFPARINERANRITLPVGVNVYAISTLLELPHFKRIKLDLTIDNKPHKLDTAMLAIGNTRFFGGGMLACPEAQHNDGLLHLTSIEKAGRLTLLLHLKGRAGGTAGRHEVLRDSGRKLRIHTEGIAFRGDGEFIAYSPLQIELVPGALMVR